MNFLYLNKFLAMITTFILISCVPESSNVPKKTAAVAPAPGAFSISKVSSTGPDRLEITWEKSTGANSYTLQYGTSSGNYNTIVSTKAVSPMTISGLNAGSTYYVMISAVNSSGSKNAEAQLSGVTQAAPVMLSNTTNSMQAPSVVSSQNISQKYRNDIEIWKDPNVLFNSDFENDLTDWTNVSWADPGLSNESSLMTVITSTNKANGGSKYLQSKVTKSQLNVNGGDYQYISAQIQHHLKNPSDIIYIRFYAQYVGLTETPHHWIRVGAGNSAGGQANVKPKGDTSFWFDLDPQDNGQFLFYAYWHQMKSGRCENGTATPGCAGDQGTTYYYGNVFNPANQTPFPRDKWFCIEYMAKANTVGKNDGELALWKDDILVGEYKPGTPVGHWRRASFLTWGEWFNPTVYGNYPFEGFNFRTSDAVKFSTISVDAYYQRDTTTNLNAPEAQTILYDDFVVATKRIGCKSK